MFSFITANAIRKSMLKIVPKTSALVVTSKRPFLSELGLESKLIDTGKGGKDVDALELWREKEDSSKALTLKTDDQIENYILQISRDYFRTTKKAKLTMNSSYKDHGLDSLDLIELIIQVEDDLGYVVDAENLQKFQKPKHFVNFIKHIEAYKTEFGKLPHQVERATFDLKKAFAKQPKKEDDHHH